MVGTSFGTLIHSKIQASVLDFYVFPPRDMHAQPLSYKGNISDTGINTEEDEHTFPRVKLEARDLLEHRKQSRHANQIPERI